MRNDREWLQRRVHESWVEAMLPYANDIRSMMSRYEQVYSHSGASSFKARFNDTDTTLTPTYVDILDPFRCFELDNLNGAWVFEQAPPDVHYTGIPLDTQMRTWPGFRDLMDYVKHHALGTKTINRSTFVKDRIGMFALIPTNDTQELDPYHEQWYNIMGKMLNDILDEYTVPTLSFCSDFSTDSSTYATMNFNDMSIYNFFNYLQNMRIYLTW